MQHEFVGVFQVLEAQFTPHFYFDFFEGLPGSGVIKSGLKIENCFVVVKPEPLTPLLVMGHREHDSEFRNVAQIKFIFYYKPYYMVVSALTESIFRFPFLYLLPCKVPSILFFPSFKITLNEPFVGLILHIEVLGIFDDRIDLYPFQEAKRTFGMMLVIIYQRKSLHQSNLCGAMLTNHGGVFDVQLFAFVFHLRYDLPFALKPLPKLRLKFSYFIFIQSYFMVYFLYC